MSFVSEILTPTLSKGEGNVTKLSGYIVIPTKEESHKLLS